MIVVYFLITCNYPLQTAAPLRLDRYDSYTNTTMTSVSSVCFVTVMMIDNWMQHNKGVAWSLKFAKRKSMLKYT